MAAGGRYETRSSTSKSSAIVDDVDFQELKISDIIDETEISGTYELCSQYREEKAQAFHFLLYLKFNGKVMRISHMQMGYNLIVFINEDQYHQDIEEKKYYILATGTFKCKQNEIYKRVLSLWYYSDVLTRTTYFPSSCSGFSLCALIYISDDFCNKLIKYMKYKELGVIKLGGIKTAIYRASKEIDFPNETKKSIK